MFNFSEFLIDWNELKNISEQKNIKLNYEIIQNGIYKVYTCYYNNKYFTILYDPTINIVGIDSDNESNYNDFITNYKPLIDDDPPYFIFPVGVPDIGKIGSKLQVQTSPRPDSFNKKYFSVWSSSGDDITTHELFGGEKIHFIMSSNEYEKTINVYFDSIFGETWIREGYAIWNNCGAGVYFSGSIYAPPTSLQTSSDLHLILEGNKVKFSPNGPNTGTHGFAGTPILVPNKLSSGSWDYSIDGGLTPNYTDTGKYDIFNVEKEVLKLVNDAILIGSSNNYFKLDNSDVANISSPYFIKTKIKNVSNSECSVAILLSLYREIA